MIRILYIGEYDIKGDNTSWLEYRETERNNGRGWNWVGRADDADDDNYNEIIVFITWIDEENLQINSEPMDDDEE